MLKQEDCGEWRDVKVLLGCYDASFNGESSLGTLSAFLIVFGTRHNLWVCPKRALNPLVLPPPETPRQIMLFHCPPHTNLHCRWCLQIPA